MTDREVVQFTDSVREARAEELEREIRKIVKQSFTPADANRNPRFNELIRKLAGIRRQYLPSVYEQFDVPPPSDVRSSFGLFGGTRTVSSSQKGVSIPAPSRSKPRHEISAEAQAIIDAVRARKPGDAESAPSEVKHITGKLAEKRAKVALDLVSTPRSKEALRRSDAKGMRHMRTFAKSDAPRATEAIREPSAPVRAPSETARFEERRACDTPAKRLLAETQAGSNARADAIIARLREYGDMGASFTGKRAPSGFFSEELIGLVKELQTIRPMSTRDIATNILKCKPNTLVIRIGENVIAPPREKRPAPAPAETRQERARAGRKTMTGERERILELVKKRTSLKGMAEALGTEVPNINYFLRMMGLNSSTARMKIQLEANPRIKEILAELETLKLPAGTKKAPYGFYTTKLFALTDELKSLYEIRDDGIAALLNCSTSSFKVRKSELGAGDA